MVIHGLQKLTLLDYPGHTACTVFTAHCPWRCPFCHNASLVLEPESQPVIPEEEIFSFLAHRKGLLDGVAVTGGEPTLQRDLPEFLRKIKALGFAVKLDTNGTNPAMLRAILSEKLADYVAMDIKPDGRTIPPSPARCVPAWPPWRSAPGCSWTAIPILNSARRSCAACTRRRILPISPRGCRGTRSISFRHSRIPAT